MTNYWRFRHISFDGNIPGIKSSISVWSEGENIADSGNGRKDTYGR